jgi:hypothetical protein
MTKIGFFQETFTIVVRTNIQAAGLATCNRLNNTEHSRSQRRNTLLLENSRSDQPGAGRHDLDTVAGSRYAQSLKLLVIETCVRQSLLCAVCSRRRSLHQNATFDEAKIFLTQESSLSPTLFVSIPAPV